MASVDSFFAADRSAAHLKVACEYKSFSSPHGDMVREPSKRQSTRDSVSVDKSLSQSYTSQSLPGVIKAKHRGGPAGVVAYNQWPGVPHAREFCLQGLDDRLMAGKPQRTASLQQLENAMLHVCKTRIFLFLVLPIPRHCNRIYQNVRAASDDGRWRAGSRLPSFKALTAAC